MARNYYPYKFTDKADSSIVKYGIPQTFHTPTDAGGKYHVDFMLDDNTKALECEVVERNVLTHPEYDIEFIGDRPDDQKVWDDGDPNTRAVDPLA